MRTSTISRIQEKNEELLAGRFPVNVSCSGGTRTLISRRPGRSSSSWSKGRENESCFTVAVKRVQRICYRSSRDLNNKSENEDDSRRLRLWIQPVAETAEC